MNHIKVLLRWLFIVTTLIPITPEKCSGQKTEIIIQKKHSESITAIAVSRANNLLVTGDIGKLNFWDLHSQKNLLLHWGWAWNPF